MAHPLQITVTQTIPELRKLQRTCGELISKRLLLVIEIKRHEKTGFQKISKAFTVPSFNNSFRYIMPSFTNTQ